MSDKPIAYEPHPITPERKRELRSKGYDILDAKFAPVEPKKPRGRPRKDG